MTSGTIPTRVDVIVIGGGAAGLTAAIALGRARRSVIVIDAGEPRNAPADGVHNLLGHDGIAPLELVRRGRAEAERYGVHFLEGTATTAARTNSGFEVEAAGARLEARRLIVATGAVDALPPIPGLSDHWGHSVLHCPYCHGWEVQDTRIGIIGTSPMSVHQALMWRQWSDRIVLFSNTAPEHSEQELLELRARGVQVVAGLIAGVESVDGKLSTVVLESGQEHGIDALVVATELTVRADVLAELGLTPQPLDNGFGAAIASDAMRATTVPGVWVAGNVTDPFGTVAFASADGLRAGSAANADLIAEDVRIAVAAAG